MAELWVRCFEYYHAYRSGNTFNECLCVAHLIKFHLLQWEDVIVKFLMNFNMTSTVLNLHQKTDPKVKQDFKGQLPTPYGFRDIAQIRFYRSRSLQQGQRSNQGQTMTLHTYTP